MRTFFWEKLGLRVQNTQYEVGHLIIWNGYLNLSYSISTKQQKL